MINCSNTFTDNLEQLWNFPPSPTELCGRGYHSIHKWDYWNPYINRCTTHNDYKGLTVEVGRSLQNLGHDVSTRGCRNIKTYTKGIMMVCAVVAFQCVVTLHLGNTIL